MERTMNMMMKRAGAALAVALLAALWSAAPATAQERFQVLVVNLAPQGGADDDFGKDIAEELQELIQDMPRHTSVSDDDLDDALDKFDLDADDLDCIKARQLAIQMGVGLVLCGQYTPQRQVSAEFIGAETGETFEVQPFQASDDRQAARQILAQFERYTSLLQFAVWGNDYMQNQQYASALENFDKALAIDPTAQSALYGKGRALMEMDSLRESLATFEQLLEVNQTHQDAILSAGIVSARLNEKDQAREYFANYLELNPGNIDVRLQVATDLANAGDPEGALRIAQEGAQLDTTNNLTLTQYIGDFALNAAMQIRAGGANGEPGDTARAHELFQTALESYRTVFAAEGDSTDIRMLRNMMSVLVELDRDQEAVDLGRQVTAAAPDDAQIWYTYATALQNAGNTPGAIDALERVVELDPTNTNAMKAMAVYLVQAGELSRARQVTENAMAGLDSSQRDAFSDDIARAIFAEGYNNKYKQGQSGAARDYWSLARSLATTAQTRSMIDFWRGFSMYEQAQQVQEPNTAESARRALPMFQEARQLIESGSAYARTQPSVPLQKIMDAIDDYIEIQELLIQRGR
ncbi:MAG: tetratricopeptide repeat protein [Longimicrobiales bacterium]